MAPRAKRNNVRKKRRDNKKKPTTKALVAARGPIIETKKLTRIVNVSTKLTSQASHTYPVESYTKHLRGLDGDQFVGDSIYPKYYSQKLKFTFARDENAIRDNYKIEVIHGWMTIPFGLDGQGLAPGLPKTTVSAQELVNLMSDRLSPAFNQSLDDMVFRDKQKNIYRILGRQWIRPDRNAGIGMPQSFGRYAAETDHLIGGPPPVKIQLNWKCGFKMKLQDTTGGTGGTAFSYPNESRVPFVIIYTPDYTNLPKDSEGNVNEDAFVEVRQSDCLWYSDS